MTNNTAVSTYLWIFIAYIFIMALIKIFLGPTKNEPMTEPTLTSHDRLMIAKATYYRTLTRELPVISSALVKLATPVKLETKSDQKTGNLAEQEKPVNVKVKPKKKVVLPNLGRIDIPYTITPIPVGKRIRHLSEYR